jgi:hypothetical protein
VAAGGTPANLQAVAASINGSVYFARLPATAEHRFGCPTPARHRPGGRCIPLLAGHYSPVITQSYKMAAIPPQRTPLAHPGNVC